MRLGALAVVAVAAGAMTAALALGGAGRGHDAFAVVPLVSDGGVPAHARDRSLVNAWGLAAEPGGAWWTANEANDSSTVYSALGRKQLLTVSVPGGPTGIVTLRWRKESMRFEDYSALEGGAMDNFG